MAMKTLAKLVVCLAVVLVAFFLGGFAKAHRMTGEILDVKHLVVEECRSRQAVLMDIDRSTWNDTQRQAFDNLCLMPPFTQADYRESRGFAADAILFLGVAIAFYLAVVIVRALKTPKV
jgi:hypothetical protein